MVNRAHRSNSLDAQSRDALFASLPFVAAFGMHSRERSLKQLLSTASQHEHVTDASEADVSDTCVLYLSAQYPSACRRSPR